MYKRAGVAVCVIKMDFPFSSYASCSKTRRRRFGLAFDGSQRRECLDIFTPHVNSITMWWSRRRENGMQQHKAVYDLTGSDWLGRERRGWKRNAQVPRNNSFSLPSISWLSLSREINNAPRGQLEALLLSFLDKWLGCVGDGQKIGRHTFLHHAWCCPPALHC